MIGAVAGHFVDGGFRGDDRPLTVSLINLAWIFPLV